MYRKIHNDLFDINYYFLSAWSKQFTIQYNTIQYDTIRYNTIRYNTIQYDTIQYNTIRYNTIQYNGLFKVFGNWTFTSTQTLTKLAELKFFTFLNREQ